MLYRKKPVQIEAKQWDGTAPGATSIINWILANGSTATYECSNPDRCVDNSGDTPHAIAIKTLEGTMRASRGDWVIRGVQGEFYPCRDDIFRQTYEAAERTAELHGRIIITWPAPTTAGVLPIHPVTITDADTGEQIVTGVKLALTLGTDTGYTGDIIEAEITALVNADGNLLGAGEQAVRNENGDWVNTKVFRFAVAEMRIQEA